MSVFITRNQVACFELVHSDLTDLVRSFHGNPPEELRNALQATTRFIERCNAQLEQEEEKWKKTR